MPIKPVTAGLLLAALVMAQPRAVMASPDDRMAGSVYVAPRHDEKPQQETAEKKESREVPDAAPGSTIDVDYKALEWHGLLTQAGDGGLGADVWRGSARSTLTENLPEIPAQSPYRTMAQLAKRLLLTRADPGLLKQDEKPQAGADLTTLRMEKLMEMGAYQQTWALYTAAKGEPYHEHFARLGVLAALYSHEPALACLETRTVEKRFEDVIFWQQLSKICTYILSKAGGATDPGKDIQFADSKILDQVVGKKTFRFKPSTLSDLQALAPLEAAVLAADNRFDFSGLHVPDDRAVPPHVMSLIMEDPSLPEEQAFRLLLRSVELGQRLPEELGKYYESKAIELFGKDKRNTSLAGFVSSTGWKRLPYVYRAATNAPGPKELETITRKALELVPEYGTAALWPLAKIIADADPSEYGPETIRSGLLVLEETGTPASAGWVKAWQRLQAQPDSDKLAGIMILAADNLSTEDHVNKPLQEVDFMKSLEKQDSQAKAIILVSYEKLDNPLKLHNYSASIVYEKLPDLTSSVDYVMPSSGLLDRLNKAESEQRLGEIILLSSIALRDAPPEKLDPELFQEVLNGLLTVGLIKEAQSLANEVILGLSKK